MTPASGNSTTKATFIVFSDDWGIHPSSSQHIFRHIAERHSIEWINTVGMRRPKFDISDFEKGIRKLTGMLRKSAAHDETLEGDNIRIHQPFMIPFNDIRIIRYLNKRSVERTLRNIVLDLENELPIVVTTVPNACDYVDSVPSSKVVYYCVDDFSEWPGLDKQLVLQMERKLLDKADSFLATSPQLFERLSESGKPTEMLSHGVDIDLFSSESDDEHALLREIPTPRVGYFGLFDARSDQQLIADVASKLPELSFVIAGRVETEIQQLRDVPNVFFTGLLPYPELPELVKGLDVLFIPYIVNALSDALSPLKFKEYLATGKPVLSTPIAAASDFADCISIASTSEDWFREITAMLSNPQQRRKQQMLERLSGESWVDKASKFLLHCIR